MRDLLKAWKIMGNEAPKLIMCGIGPLEDWCKQFIDDNGLHNIELKGFVENKVVKQLIAGSNALILPSQVYEGFPMAIVEAYSVGTPVIGSDLGNTGSLIKSGITGLKYDHKNVESMVDAVKQMEEHPFRCDLNIFKQFSVEKNNCVLESIYLSAMSK